MLLSLLDITVSLIALYVNRGNCNKENGLLNLNQIMTNIKIIAFIFVGHSFNIHNKIETGSCVTTYNILALFA